MAPSIAAPTVALDHLRIAIVGLGYVGLPLAMEFGKRYDTVGYDVDAARVQALRDGVDRTGEVAQDALRAATRLRLSTDLQDIAACDVFIVTVPTPVDAALQPDLAPLRQVSQALGGILKRGDTVVYESTVYPGTTQEICVPILERVSGLRCGADFGCGYSPERINPGDRTRRVTDILKLTSGSDPRTADLVDALYRSVITAGTHRAGSIRVAEAAKVIENVQRDVNIALVNELALIFERLGIDSEQVLEAAGTKWNFLKFRPGLVGGHCIGVDPYYLSHKSESVGYHPELILAARRINNKMAVHVADRVIRLMCAHRLPVAGGRILVLGLAFKEDCPDLRNTKVVDLIGELRGVHAQVDVFDPWVDPAQAEREYALTLLDAPQDASYEAVVIAVGHSQFRALGAAGIRALCKPGGVIYDVKYVLPADAVDGRL